jgi:hypothetical protein
MNLAQTLNKLEQKGYGFRPKGFFNVEGGDAAIATDFLGWCDCQSLIVGPTTSVCSECNRGPENFIRVPAGDGDSVYVVFEVFELASPRHPVGAFTVFDHGYGIANKVRSFVTEQEPLVFSMDEVLVFGDAIPLGLVDLAATSSIYFADGSSGGANSSNANVDIQFGKDQKLRVFGFVETVPTDPQANAEYFAANWKIDIEAILRTMQGSFAIAQSLAESFGRELKDPLPPYSIRCLLALSQELAAELDLRAEAVVEDWEMFSIQLNARVVSSHKERQDISTIWMNAMLAREWDRQAGDVSDDEAKRLLFDVWTWAYQGITSGDRDCLELIQNSYKASNEEIADLLRRRGLFDLADQLISSGQLPGMPQENEEAEQPQSNPGLTKSSSGGLGLGATGSKFCSNCGQQLAESAKFCTECGTPRA